MEDQIRHIQIYGERYSGTNFLQHLLEKNLSDISIDYKFGWKHFFINGDVENASNFLFVVIYRDPFDWLRSFHSYPYHAAPEIKKARFSQFIRHEWWCAWDEDAGKSPEDPIYGKEMMFERDPKTLNRFSNVIRLRTAKIKNWESLVSEAHEVSLIHCRCVSLYCESNRVKAGSLKRDDEMPV